MSQQSRELRAKRFKLVADARELISGAVVTPETSKRFDKMMAQADAIGEQIERMERADREESDLREAAYHRARGAGVAPAAKRGPLDKDVRDDAFLAYLRNGMEGLSAEHRAVAESRFRAAQGTTPGSEGGYTVPEGFYHRLIDAQLAFGGMMEPGASFVFNTETGNPLPVPMDDDTSNEGVILGENTQVSAQDVAFSQLTLNAFTYTSKLVLVSNELLQDSAFDLDSFLTKRLGVRIARVVNRHFTTGDGSSKPRGVVTDAVLGVATASASAITPDELVDLEHSVDPAYRNNARFMLHDTTLKLLQKMKDSTGRPLWSAGLEDGAPDTIYGKPYIVNQSLDVVAPSAKPMLFGDFGNYFVRRVAGVRVLRLTERYADFNQVGFLAFQRWDGALADAGTHPVKYLAMHS